MHPIASIIIPNFNGQMTIETCLGAAFASDYPDFEVIVVDDKSEDNSVELINKFPCRLLKLEKHSGAAAARNAGAAISRGQLLFFTDADCVLESNTVSEVCDTLLANGPNYVVGGTYLRQSHDENFFSRFQSVFINYSETKHLDHPDYVATHAMGIHASTFKKTDGFKERWLPILEDVEFSHRLCRMGYRLMINPKILVQHIFNFSLKKSILNALNKSSYWTLYSIANKDLLTDSGTASYEIKANVILFYLALIALIFFISTENMALFALFFSLIIANVLINRHLLKALYDAYGFRFCISSALYYLWVYPLPVSMGGLIGILKYFRMTQPLVLNK